jgi:hypothetical protein
MDAFATSVGPADESLNLHSQCKLGYNLCDERPDSSHSRAADKEVPPIITDRWHR